MVWKTIVRMIRKYHIHKLQTNPWHREEEPHNYYETPGRQTKQINQLSLRHQDDCKTRMTAKHRTITESHNGSKKQQRINNNRNTALEGTAAKVFVENWASSSFMTYIQYVKLSRPTTKSNFDFSKCSLIQNIFWTHWIQRIGPIHDIFLIAVYYDIYFGCVKETTPSDDSFTCPTLMFDRKTLIPIVFILGGEYIFYIYLPIIRTTDNSKLRLYEIRLVFIIPPTNCCLR